MLHARIVYPTGHDKETTHMALGYDGKLYILAFDHRGSFQKKMFGIEGDPTAEQTDDDRRRQAPDLRGAC